MLNVDGQKEMTQRVRYLLAVLVKTAQGFEVGTILQRGGQHFHHRRITVTFIPAGSLTQTTQRSQSRQPFGEVNKHLLRVGTSLAFFINHPARRKLLPRTAVHFNFSPLAHAGGAVQNKGKLLVGGKTEGKGVGAQHVLHTVGGGNRGPGVGPCHPDHSGLGSHGGVVTGNSVMGGIAHRHHPQTVLLRLVDGHLHRCSGHHMTHPVVSVQHGGGLGILNNINLRNRVQNPRIDAVQINRFEPAYPVGVDTPLIRFNEHFGNNFRIIPGYPDIHQTLFHKIFQQLEFYPFAVLVFFRVVHVFNSPLSFYLWFIRTGLHRRNHLHSGSGKILHPMGVRAAVCHQLTDFRKINNPKTADLTDFRRIGNDDNRAPGPLYHQPGKGSLFGNRGTHTFFQADSIGTKNRPGRRQILQQPYRPVPDNTA